MNKLTVLGLGLITSMTYAAPQKVSGEVGGFGQLRNDDVLDMAIVLPSITEEQILSFDFGSVFAPNEPLHAGPQTADVPGNIFAPRQRESYGWFPLTIKKESFSVLHEAGTEAELFTIAVQAPFNDLVGKARRKEPNAELMKLISFNKLGFEAARDWSQAGRLSLNLQDNRPKRSQLNWQRSGARNGESDIILQLEETPMGRYIISDFHMDPGSSESFRATDFDGEARFLAGRMKFNANDDFEALNAWVVESDRGERSVVEGLPQEVTQSQISDNQRVSWSPDGRKGFVTVFVERKEEAQLNWMPQKIEEIFFPDLSDLYKSRQQKGVLAKNWVAFESGSLDLDAPLGVEDSLELIALLGGNGEAPNLKSSQELLIKSLR